MINKEDIMAQLEVTVSLPNYAQHTDSTKLVKLLCKGKCGGLTRWAELNTPYPGETKLRKAEMGTYNAKCLKCGTLAIDSYNWFRP